MHPAVSQTEEDEVEGHDEGLPAPGRHPAEGARLSGRADQAPEGPVSELDERGRVAARGGAEA